MSLNNRSPAPADDLASDEYADFISRRGVHLSGVVVQHPGGFPDGTPLPPPLDLTSENGERASVAAYAAWYDALDAEKLASGDYSAKMGPRSIRPPQPYATPGATPAGE